MCYNLTYEDDHVYGICLDALLIFPVLLFCNVAGVMKMQFQAVRFLWMNESLPQHHGTKPFRSGTLPQECTGDDWSFLWEILTGLIAGNTIAVNPCWE